uniref:Peptidase A1 domain-containing protein n=1 Tax=Caenorhabditis tropicalis TaxID=1561998 RepID=A0A1I7TB45_9PELO
MAQVLHLVMLRDEVKQIPLATNIVTNSSIKSAFLLQDDALISLSYEEGGIRKWCTSTDHPEKKFLLPNNWESIPFVVESNKLPTRPASMMDMITERPISPYFPEIPPSSSPKGKAFIQWMFYVQDDLGKASTVCLHPRFFATFRHGSHLSLKLGDKLTMYNADTDIDQQTGTIVTVAKIDESLDFVILQSNEDVVSRGPTVVHPEDGEPYTSVGFGNDNGHLSYTTGIVNSTKDYYFTGATQLGPFMLGTSLSSRGDSGKDFFLINQKPTFLGGGIWGPRGLLGIIHGCTTMPPQNHFDAISEAATFSKKCIFCPAFWLKKAVMELLETDQKKEKSISPPQKKPCIMTDVEGLGIFYGSSS